MESLSISTSPICLLYAILSWRVHTTKNWSTCSANNSALFVSFNTSSIWKLNTYCNCYCFDINKSALCCKIQIFGRKIHIKYLLGLMLEYWKWHRYLQLVKWLDLWLTWHRLNHWAISWMVREVAFWWN